MTTYINTPAGSGTDNTKCTISFWLKQTHDQGNESPYLFSGGDGASNNFWIRLQSDGRLYLRNRTSGGNDCVKIKCDKCNHIHTIDEGIIVNNDSEWNCWECYSDSDDD